MTRNRLPLPEFIALTAMTIASTAFSIDAMLPAMTDIAAELTPDAPNRAQLIITAFVLGMGLGTFVTGPIADRVGRKPVILGGFALYFLGAALSVVAPTLELALFARIAQGLGAAGPRIAILAIVRDQFEGRRMAQVMSFAMMVFTLVPAVAPLVGTGIIALAGWRGIFVAFMLWAVVVSLWLGLRQPETLTPERRRPLRPAVLAAGITEILSNRNVVLVIAVLTLIYGILFGTLSSVQQIFARTFQSESAFPWYFGGISLIAAGASFLNASIVVQLGMRPVIRATLLVELILSATLALITATGALQGTAYFAAFLFWIQSIFFMMGLCLGNLNALGMEPLGHLAGLGSSVISALSTVAAVAIAVPIGLAFDGTPLALAIGSCACCAGALILLHFVERPGTAET